MSVSLKDGFGKYMANIFKARFPVIYLSTWEEGRAIEVLNEIVSDPALIKTVRKVYIWSVTDGMVINGKKGSEDSKAPLKALEMIEECAEPALFILKDIHTYFGSQGRSADHQVVRKIRDLTSLLKQKPQPQNIVLLSPCLSLPVELQKDVTIIEFELPTIEEIKCLLNEMIDANSQCGRISINLTSEEVEKLAKAALGLTLQEAENAFARSMVDDGKLLPQDVEIVLEEKCQVIKKTGILEFIKSDLNIDDVGGLENLKNWLRKRDKSWLDIAAKYRLSPPKGVLITGVPGCGKSLIAKSISAMWQLPLLRLDIGKIFSGLVGSSEENMRRAIMTAEAVAPSILWIDEIEKGFSGTGSAGDSGTSTRIFGTFLTWMQEKNKPVFVVATANNISALPPELLRKGRFDEIFFVDLPTKKERVEIFRLHMNKRMVDADVLGGFIVTEEVIAGLADMSEGFSGAEIEQVILSALFEAFSESRSIKLEDFQKAIQNTVSLSVTQAEQIRTLRNWASVRAVTATPQVDRAEYKGVPVTLKEEDKKPDHDDIKNTRGGRTVDF